MMNGKTKEVEGVSLLRKHASIPKNVFISAIFKQDNVTDAMTGPRVRRSQIRTTE